MTFAEHVTVCLLDLVIAGIARRDRGRARIEFARAWFQIASAADAIDGGDRLRA